MLELYDIALSSRLLLGTSRYPSPAVLSAAVRAARAQVVTVSLRRESAGERAGQGFWALVRELGVRVLPNTAGCHSVKEAMTTAHMAREVFGTPWIKLEVIGEHDTLQPDVFGLTEAARLLCAEGFQVFPYTTEDLVVAERLLEAGCRVLMPWGAPIGSGRGLSNLYGLRTLRAHFPRVPLIIDAGLGVPSHAAQALEIGFDAVLINTAIAQARDPVQMAAAFSQAVEAGAAACAAGPIEARDLASPSTPVIGTAFLGMKLPRVYPIIDSAAWVGRLAPCGVRLLQLRIKERPLNWIEAEIRQALGACRARGIQLIVNDYWHLALRAGCDFVHLGQGDLDHADLAVLRRNQVRIGISTHDEPELERALALKPDYVALGPIYPTKLKIMPWAPQGLERIGEWKRRLGELPLVAIGGVTLERLPEVLSAGADVAAVVTDILAAGDPEARARRWIEEAAA